MDQSDAKSALIDAYTHFLFDDFAQILQLIPEEAKPATFIHIHPEDLEKYTLFTAKRYRELLKFQLTQFQSIFVQFLIIEQDYKKQALHDGSFNLFINSSAREQIDELIAKTSVLSDPFALYLLGMMYTLINPEKAFEYLSLFLESNDLFFSAWKLAGALTPSMEAAKALYRRLASPFRDMFMFEFTSINEIPFEIGHLSRFHNLSWYRSLCIRRAVYKQDWSFAYENYEKIDFDENAVNIAKIYLRSNGSIKLPTYDAFSYQEALMNFCRREKDGDSNSLEDLFTAYKMAYFLPIHRIQEFYDVALMFAFELSMKSATKAINTLNTLLLIRQWVPATLLLSEIFERENRSMEAIRSLKSVLRYNNTNISVYLRIADLYYSLSRDSDAKEILLIAVFLSFEEHNLAPESYYKIGKALEKAGEADNFNEEEIAKLYKMFIEKLIEVSTSLEEIVTHSKLHTVPSEANKFDVVAAARDAILFLRNHGHSAIFDHRIHLLLEDQNIDVSFQDDEWSEGPADFDEPMSPISGEIRVSTVRSPLLMSLQSPSQIKHFDV